MSYYERQRSNSEWIILFILLEFLLIYYAFYYIPLFGGIFPLNYEYNGGFFPNKFKIYNFYGEIFPLNFQRRNLILATLFF